MQFTTAKKKIHLDNKAEKLVSHMQIELDSVVYKYLHVKKLLLISHFVDFHPCIIKYLSPIFITENAIDFLISNAKQIERPLTIENFIEYGKMHKLIVDHFKFNPKDLKDLKQLYLSVKSCTNDKQIS